MHLWIINVSSGMQARGQHIFEKKFVLYVESKGNSVAFNTNCLTKVFVFKKKKKIMGVVHILLAKE